METWESCLLAVNCQRRHFPVGLWPSVNESTMKNGDNNPRQSHTKIGIWQSCNRFKWHPALGAPFSWTARVNEARFNLQTSVSAHTTAQKQNISAHQNFAVNMNPAQQASVIFL